MELVQLHERSWGMEQYPDRPPLVKLLSSPITVMWMADHRRSADGKITTFQDPEVSKRFMFSVHESVEELNEILLALVFTGKMPSTARRISKIYVRQKPVEIKGVRLILAEK